MLCSQQRESAHHAILVIAGFGLLAIKPLDEEHVVASHGFHSAFRNLQSARLGKDKHRALYASVVPSVFGMAELRYPKTRIVLDDSFRTRTTHCCSAQQEPLHLLGLGTPQRFIVDEPMSNRLQLLELKRLVEIAHWCWRCFV